jgi:Molybdopterin biosynthesis enzymes
MAIDTSLEFVPINIAVLTISDTRTEETDTSGALLKKRINIAGHHCIEKENYPLMI